MKLFLKGKENQVNSYLNNLKTITKYFVYLSAAVTHIMIVMKWLKGEISDCWSLKGRSDINGIMQDAFTQFLFCSSQMNLEVAFFLTNGTDFVYPPTSIFEQDNFCL